jgi:hypothetical protein
MDYEQLLFKCRGCHEYGHFQRNYPKTPPPQKRKGMKAGSRPGKGDQKQEAKEMSRQNHRKPNPWEPKKWRTTSGS